MPKNIAVDPATARMQDDLVQRVKDGTMTKFQATHEQSKLTDAYNAREDAKRAGAGQAHDAIMDAKRTKTPTFVRGGGGGGGAVNLDDRFAKGGKVRGAGCASKGTRTAKQK